MRRLAFTAALLAAGSAAPARAAPDLGLGAEIYEVCAPCHGINGQGGGQGVYPRLAGMPVDYTLDQIRDFKRRVRTNIPMLPYATDRELPDDDVVHVAAYLRSLRLKTRLPPADAAMDGLERLNQAKQVLQIPKTEGDVAAGRALYDRACAKCHGADGYGHEKAPLLAGQFSTYLRKQIEQFQAYEREHRDTETLFEERTADEVRDLLAYLSTLDDGIAESPVPRPGE
ncbi:MAG: c-type cytochrome [Rhodobacterales bacterium]|nr:c-type cytochrome [Rhodobacterales bacterium]